MMGNVICAQEETKSDTTKINFGKSEVLIVDHEPDSISLNDTIIDWDDEDSEDLTYWGGIDMGINIWLNSDNKPEFEGDDEWLEQDYARSFSWDLNLIEKKIKIAGDYVGIVTGLGLSYKSYGLGDSVSVLNRTANIDDMGNVVTMDSTYGVNAGIEFSKNKFRTSSLKIPVLLEFNTSKYEDRNFHVTAGVLGGWNFRTMVKTVTDAEDVESKVKNKGDYNVTPFTLDAHVRVGYKNFTVFGTYGLTPFFEEGHGPDIRTATVGISLIPW